jgi:hypothetical protein
MNTGIMEDMPIILPEKPEAFTSLFRGLEKLHSEYNAFSGNREIKPYLENVANALVYSLYLLENHKLIEMVDHSIQSSKSKHYIDLYNSLNCPEILQEVKKVLQNPLVVSIENSPRMN